MSPRLLLIYLLILSSLSYSCSQSSINRDDVTMLGEVWVYKQDQTTVSGMITKYYPDGSVSGTMEVTNGVLEGSFVGYFQNGNLSIEGLFDNGKRNGEWKYYNDDGSLKKVREYHSDEVISDTRYDSEGNIHKFQQHKK